MSEKLFFQQLPEDVREKVFEAISLSLIRETEERELALLVEEKADDLINRNNVRRTIREWLEFAESGE